MNDKTYEDKISGSILILSQINEFRLAIQNGDTGSIQKEGLFMLIPTEIIADIKKGIDEIESEYNKETDRLVKSWTVSWGHPSNKLSKVNITPERESELRSLRTLANQMVVHTIIDMLHKNKMYFTDSTRMPSSLVR